MSSIMMQMDERTAAPNFRLDRPQALDELQVVSMSLSMSTSLPHTAIDVAVLLPRCRSGAFESSPLEPGINTVPDLEPIDLWSLYELVSEGPQTVQRLVLRKRTTSPYQIKLPFMTDRLCVRRSASPRTPQSCLPVSLEENVFRSVMEAQPSPNGATLPPSITSGTRCEEQSRMADVQDNRSADSQRLSLHGPNDDPALDGPGTLFTPTLSTLDTWSEICEDLCRAMEVFAVLSEVAPARFFSEATDLPQDGSQMLLATLAAGTSTYCLASSLGLEPESSTANVLAGPWNSFVFPPLVA
ncbi:hypothetical protein C8Q73DRAFT_712939 [Cubamyces lactineus]|nr:hypothetical protein C8Q73DRAFT_712939 [Cubamyces lactineus]